jgi:hypothetical protein
MPSKTGLDGQIGYVIESAWGTATAVTRFLPLVSETLSKEIEASESAATFTGQQVLRSGQWTQGNATVGGGVQHELYDQSFGLLLRAAFGTVSTAGTAVPYTHTFWPATPDVSFTCQVGRPTVYGSVIPFTYEGCKIASWELGLQPGEIVTWGMDITAEEETMGTALASASYATNLRPWHAKSAAITIAGVSHPLRGFTIGGDNALNSDRRFLGSTVISEQLRQDFASYTGQITVEWGNPSSQGTLNYHRFLGGTEAALVTTLASGTLAATITANIRYDGMTPQVAGRGVIESQIPFKAIDSGTLGSGAIQVVINNNDSAA